MSARVLCVDDERQVASVLTGALTSRGYVVQTSYDADSAMATLRGWHPAVVITELELPDIDGIELCRRVRKISNVPLIVVSGRDDSRSEVTALDSGADDYILKPFNPERLLARLRVALRRTDGTVETPALGVGAFHIDFYGRRVHVHGQPVRLTPKEFDLFVFMARHPNRVLPHKALLGAVWGEAFEDQSEYLRVFVGQLRKKLEANPSNPRYLVTEPWVGYRFNPNGVMQ